MLLKTETVAVTLLKTGAKTSGAAYQRRFLHFVELVLALFFIEIVR